MSNGKDITIRLIVESIEKDSINEWILPGTEIFRWKSKS